MRDCTHLAPYGGPFACYVLTIDMVLTKKCKKIYLLVLRKHTER